MKPHILFVLDYFTPHRGGSETVFQNLISRLHAKGYPLTILTSKFDSSLPAYEESSGIQIYRTGKSRLGFVFLALCTGRRILKKDKTISIIHSSTYGGAIPASILAQIYKKKLVLTVHEIFGKLRYLYKGRIVGKLYRCFEWLIFQFHYDVYHCVSRYTMNALRVVYGVPDDKLRMIYNGVDTAFRDKKNIQESDRHQRRITHGRDEYFVVVYYGHAGKSKGLDYLIQAMPTVLQDNPKILFACNIIQSKRTEETVDYLKLLQCYRQHREGKQRIQIYTGFDQQDLRTFVAAADMVVAPSLAEGFGSVHTETVALGVPLLTTDIGPLPEVVSGVVKMIPAASPKDITQGILEFAQGKLPYPLPPKIFSRDAMTMDIEKVYHQLISK